MANETLDSVTGHIDNLNKTIHEKDNELKRAQQELEELKTLSENDVASRNNDIEMLNKIKEDTLVSFNQLQSSYEALLKEKAELDAKNEDNFTMVATVEQKAESLNAELSEAKEKLEIMEEKLSSIR